MASTKFTVFKGDCDGKIIRGTSERVVKDDEVLVRITHSGLCGTDCHFRKAGVVLGHEGVGVIESVGSRCTKRKVGDVVGWGYIHETCNSCHQCLSGNEVFCRKAQMFGDANTDQGSLGTHAVWKEAYVFLIPESISPAHAAPLMCGGATVFSAIHNYGVKSTHTVGVVGIGGLGHLAIQFLAAMGCRVVVFSSTEDKREEALRLGATEFYPTKGVESLQVEHRCDYLLVTTSYLPDWNLYLDIMEKQGTVFPLTLANGTMDIPYFTFLLNGLHIVGSVVATRWVHNEMLEFAARHNIKAMIQEFPMSEEGITEAFDKLDTGKLRYRAVLVNN
ncbi:NADP-dependent alcohol dehydrogenase [Pyronema omphalodes]|nr:NADP-dependent alcohol dehydrogenase [Pyronema omphalodes]